MTAIEMVNLYRSMGKQNLRFSFHSPGDVRFNCLIMEAKRN